MSSSWMNDFKSPDSLYRGKPFWAWNGRLEPEELRRQIRIMHRMGLGGFFMHSRVGLDTAYLSQDWFACVDACVDEARQLGMEAWLYDEDRWPSGAAGGLVTRNPKYRQRSLIMELPEQATAAVWGEDTVAVFTAKLGEGTASNVRQVAAGAKPAPKAGEKVLVFRVKVADCSRWYNGFTYLDTMSHEAVRAFIRSTHEVYRKKNGQDFGGVIPGIFTDEPNHGGMLGGQGGWMPSANQIPWTGKLLATFKKRYGYDLTPHLVELYFDVDGNGMRPARYHYHDCLTHLYVDAFCRQIGEWCAANGLQFTGHQLEEDSLASQTNMVGSCLRCYEHMQAPGMDLLTEHWRVFNTAKQVSSGARQFGAKWRLTETYGCTGWDFPFAGHKALGDWQLALGINVRCQHLSWYTMRGEAKRDYPAGIFYQSPWWEMYPKVEDYFARLHVAMTQGEEVRDLLVVHPVESMWMLVKNGWRQTPATKALDAQFAKLTEALLSQHLDFDFGDEEQLGRLAKVAGKKASATLKMGQAVYRAVLVPELKTMRRSTLDLLQEFKAAGGTVVFAGAAAGFVEAVASSEPAAFAATCPSVAVAGPALSAALSPSSRRLSITDAKGQEILPALYLLREDQEACYLFVCNTGEDYVNLPTSIYEQPLARDRQLSFGDVRIRGFAACAGEPLELDPETGAVTAAKFSRSAAGLELQTSLPALGSRVFVLPKAKTKAGKAPAPAPALTTKHSEKLGGESWSISLSETANLVLDRPRYQIGNEAWKEANEILRIDREVRSALGIPHRSGDMVQPWARPAVAEPKRTTVKLAYSFDCKVLPSGDLFVALEEPQTFRVSLNGVPVDGTAECGWWVDRSLRKLPLDPARLHLGVNELLLECDYAETHPGLEIVYLLGNFGTAVDGTAVSLVAPPASLKLGDWVPQGLAFYSGSVSYRLAKRVQAKAGERLFVRIPEYRGVAVRVLVNGEAAGIAAWEPNEVEITSLAKGEVDLQIQVIGHRRNSHGPFHINSKWPTWTGPGEFTRGADSWIDGYQLVPCGLLAAPELIVRG